MGRKKQDEAAFEELARELTARVAVLSEPYAEVAEGVKPPTDATGAGQVMGVLGKAIDAYEAINGTERDSEHTEHGTAITYLAAQNALLHALRVATGGAPGTEALFRENASRGPVDHKTAMDFLAVAAVAFQAGRNAGHAAGEEAGVALAERRSGIAVLTPGREGRALTWIEQHEPGGIAIVARALASVGEFRPTPAREVSGRRQEKAQAKRQRRASRDREEDRRGR